MLRQVLHSLTQTHKNDNYDHTATRTTFKTVFKQFRTLRVTQNNMNVARYTKQNKGWK